MPGEFNGSGTMSCGHAAAVPPLDPGIAKRVGHPICDQSGPEGYTPKRAKARAGTR